MAAALLCRQGLRVLVLEREQFPRFSIGESLLPQSMEYLEQAGMLGAVERAGFQIKNGAAFGRGEQYTEFDFSDKFSDGWSYTYQVPRARFDHLLALEAERQGAELRFRHEVVAVDLERPRARASRSKTSKVTFDHRSRFHPRCQRLRPRPAPFAGVGNAFRLSGARRDLHSCRRPNSAERLRPQQDSHRRAARITTTCGTG